MPKMFFCKLNKIRIEDTSQIEEINLDSEHSAIVENQKSTNLNNEKIYILSHQNLEKLTEQLNQLNKIKLNINYFRQLTKDEITYLHFFTEDQKIEIIKLYDKILSRFTNLI